MVKLCGYCTSNRLREIPNLNCPNLKILNLSGNMLGGALSEINTSFKNLASLEKLIITGNFLGGRNKEVELLYCSFNTFLGEKKEARKNLQNTMLNPQSIIKTLKTLPHGCTVVFSKDEVCEWENKGDLLQELQDAEMTVELE